MSLVPSPPKAASPFAVLPLGGVTGIITDADKDAPIVQELAAAGARLLFSER